MHCKIEFIQNENWQMPTDGPNPKKSRCALTIDSIYSLCEHVYDKIYAYPPQTCIQTIVTTERNMFIAYMNFIFFSRRVV